MRAIVKFIVGGYVNIPADTIEKQDEWIMVRSGKKTMGMFDEGIVNCAYLSEKGERNDIRTLSADKN